MLLKIQKSLEVIVINIDPLILVLKPIFLAASTTIVNSMKSTRSSSLTDHGGQTHGNPSGPIKPSASVGNLKPMPKKSESSTKLDMVEVQPGDDEELALIETRKKSYAMTLNNPSSSRPSSRSPSRVANSSPNMNVNKNHSKLKSHEIDLAITLVAISLMFIVCQSIKVIPDIYEMVECDHFKLAEADNEMDQMCQMSSAFVDYLVSLGNLFCCLNSACNFLFYMLRGKKFRDAFCQIYFCCFKRDRNPSSSPTHGANSLHTTDPNTRYTTSLLASNAKITNASSPAGRPIQKRNFISIMV